MRLILTLITTLSLATVAQAGDTETAGYWRFEGNRQQFFADTGGRGVTIRRYNTQQGHPRQIELTDGGMGSHFPRLIPQNDRANDHAAYFGGDPENSHTNSGGKEGYINAKWNDALNIEGNFTIQALIHVENNALPKTDGRYIAGHWWHIEGSGWALGITPAELHPTWLKRGASAQTLQLRLGKSKKEHQRLYASELKVEEGKDYFVAVKVNFEAGTVTFHLKDLETLDAELRAQTVRHEMKGITIVKKDIFNTGSVSNNSTSQQWSGVIDEVKIDNGILPPTQFLITPYTE